MSTEVLNSFEFTDIEGYDIYFEGEKVEQGEIIYVEVETIGINYGLEIKMVSQENSAEKYFYVRTLNYDYDTVTKGEGEGDGYYYFTQSDNLYKMNTSGEIVFYKKADNKTFDFKQYTFDGEIYYTYLEKVTASADDAVQVSSTQTKAIVMDANFQVIDEIEALSTDMGMEDGLALDMHEFLMLDVDHYMLLAYVATEVDNIPTEIKEDGQAFVAASVVQEIKDGELIFQWDSSEYTEMYELNVANNPDAYDFDKVQDTAIDYLHMNSIEIDPNDGNLLFSFRRLDSVIKIDRETGEIIWILGGEWDMFGLSDYQKFSRQHFAVYFDNETITIYDNGTDKYQTRIQEFILDEENFELVSYNQYQYDTRYQSHMGSAMKLEEPSTYLIGWGGGSADGSLFIEVDFETGEIIFEAMDSDITDNSYRAYKFDS